MAVRAAWLYGVFGRGECFLVSRKGAQDAKKTWLLYSRVARRRHDPDRRFAVYQNRSKSACEALTLEGRIRFFAPLRLCVKDVWPGLIGVIFAQRRTGRREYLRSRAGRCGPVPHTSRARASPTINNQPVTMVFMGFYFTLSSASATDATTLTFWWSVSSASDSGPSARGWFGAVNTTSAASGNNVPTTSS